MYTRRINLDEAVNDTAASPSRFLTSPAVYEFSCILFYMINIGINHLIPSHTFLPTSMYFSTTLSRK